MIPYIVYDRASKVVIRAGYVGDPANVGTQATSSNEVAVMAQGQPGVDRYDEALQACVGMEYADVTPRALVVQQNVPFLIGFGAESIVHWLGQPPATLPAGEHPFVAPAIGSFMMHVVQDGRRGTVVAVQATA